MLDYCHLGLSPYDSTIIMAIRQTLGMTMMLGATQIETSKMGGGNISGRIQADSFSNTPSSHLLFLIHKNTPSSDPAPTNLIYIALFKPPVGEHWGLWDDQNGPKTRNEAIHHLDTL